MWAAAQHRPTSNHYTNALVYLDLGFRFRLDLGGVYFTRFHLTIYSTLQPFRETSKPFSRSKLVNPFDYFGQREQHNYFYDRCCFHNRLLVGWNERSFETATVRRVQAPVVEFVCAAFVSSERRSAAALALSKCKHSFVSIIVSVNYFGLNQTTLRENVKRCRVDNWLNKNRRLR